MSALPTRRLPGLTAPGAAALLGVVEAVLAVASIPLLLLTPHTHILENAQALAISVSVASVGVVVARRQPRNRIGWLLLAAGLCLMLGTAGLPYTQLAYREGHSGLPLAREVLFVESSWVLVISLLPLTVLLFPDGRLPSRIWRWALWPYLAASAVWVLGVFAVTAAGVFALPIRVDTDGSLLLVNDPTGSWAWFGTVQKILTPVFVVFWLCFLLRVATSWRGSSGVRRAQLKWLMCGGGVCIASGAVGALVPAFDSHPSPALRVIQAVVTFGVVALPLGIGVGILRYQLYDIDRLVSRTLSYAILTGLLAAIYLSVVTLATRALPLSSPVGVAASTLAAAALFNPLRTRVQRTVDRRFNRARYDAEATLAAFGDALRDAIDLDSVQARLLGAIEATVAPDQASLWLRSRDHPSELA